jgi:uncharacterized protein YyaL (SSP411 family)
VRGVRTRFRPNVVLAVAAPGDADDSIPLLRDRPQIDGKTTAYVCQRFACKLPVTERAQLEQQLDA